MNSGRGIKIRKKLEKKTRLIWFGMSVTEDGFKFKPWDSCKIVMKLFKPVWQVERCEGNFRDFKDLPKDGVVNV